MREVSLRVERQEIAVVYITLSSFFFLPSIFLFKGCLPCYEVENYGKISKNLVRGEENKPTIVYRYNR